jgi:hypothetical protein
MAGPWSNRHVLETPEEIDRLQELLDRSAAGAGAHLKGIISDDHRLSAVRVCERLQGMQLLVVATVTADGRPLAGPVDGYFLHGSFYFSSGRDSVRMRHLAARPAVSATHLAGEELAVTVHGRAELFDVSDPPALNCDRRCSTITCPGRDRRSRPGWTRPTRSQRASTQTRCSHTARTTEPGRPAFTGHNCDRWP